MPERAARFAALSSGFRNVPACSCAASRRVRAARALRKWLLGVVPSLGLLRDDEEANDHDGDQCRRDDEIVQAQPALRGSFVERVVNGRAQGPRENKGRPEQQNVRNLRSIPQPNDDGQNRADQVKHRSRDENALAPVLR